MEYEKNFSRNVRRLRKKLGMTQKQLADATGYSEKSVSKWERGPSIPAVATLFAIARALNTNMETLFLDEYETLCLQCRRPRFHPWVGKIPWRRAWQPTPVILPEESHGQTN